MWEWAGASKPCKALPGVPLIAILAAGAAVPRVVGGSVVPTDAWPDAAAVYRGEHVVCTGTLVAPALVLTAGHCAEGITAVKVGVARLDAGERIPVREVIAHPDALATYDVALAVLEWPAEVEPRALLRDCVAGDALLDGAPVVVVGYGATDELGERYGLSLVEGGTRIEDADCSDLEFGCNEAVSPGGELRAGGNGVDACFGDSGGPLYIVTDEGVRLAGITSRGYDTSLVPCSEGGIYVRADAVAGWIEEVSGETLPAPECEVEAPPARCDAAGTPTLAGMALWVLFRTATRTGAPPPPAPPARSPRRACRRAP